MFIRKNVALSGSSYSINRVEMNPTAIPLIYFWLPVALIAVVVFDNHARLEYAETAIGMERDYRDEVEASTSSSKSRQVTFLCFAATGIFLLSRKRQSTLEVSHWTITVPVVFVLLFMMCSTLWSDAPMTTFRRSVLASCIAIGAWGLGKSWSLREFCLAITILSGTILVAGVVAEVYFGTFLGAGEGDYRFSGVLHPARESFSCSLMALASFALYRLEKRRIYLLLAAVAIAFALLTKARTGAGALFIASVWFWWRQLSTKQIIAAAWAGLVVASLLLISMGVSSNEFSIGALARMGRTQELADPATFTGRLPIWSLAMDFFSERPILGFGYGAFWNSQRIEFFERQTGWTFTHAHSAYVESLVNVGLAGLLIGFVAIAATFRRCGRLTSVDVVTGSFVGSLLIYGLVSGVAESAFVDEGYELIVALIGISHVAFRKIESGVGDV